MTHRENPVSEAQVQDFWTTFPVVYGPTTTPEQVFENMERVLRAEYWFMQAPGQPLLSRYLDYAASPTCRFPTGFSARSVAQRSCAGTEASGSSMQSSSGPSD